MNLDYKRFRSKAPSASSLSPGSLVFLRTKGFDLLRTHSYDTVSEGGWRINGHCEERNDEAISYEILSSEGGNRRSRIFCHKVFLFDPRQDFSVGKVIWPP